MSGARRTGRSRNARRVPAAGAERGRAVVVEVVVRAIGLAPVILACLTRPFDLLVGVVAAVTIGALVWFWVQERREHRRVAERNQRSERGRPPVRVTSTVTVDLGDRVVTVISRDEESTHQRTGCEQAAHKAYGPLKHSKKGRK
jgi:hypothetical protein